MIANQSNGFHLIFVRCSSDVHPMFMRCSSDVRQMFIQCSSDVHVLISVNFGFLGKIWVKTKFGVKNLPRRDASVQHISKNILGPWRNEGLKKKLKILIVSKMVHQLSLDVYIYLFKTISDCIFSIWSQWSWWTISELNFQSNNFNISKQTAAKLNKLNTKKRFLSIIMNHYITWK